ncbi:MAG: polyprenyl synthetase family protein [Actinomycetota bacterium]|nr:polyprenyl synthetase family protein [Actinomycetota bacterium]
MAPPILEKAAAMCEGELRAAVGRLGSELSRPAFYHFGWTDAGGVPQSANGGKGVRSALALLSATAAGAAAETGVPGAVAVELVHNFSLIHDDIIDGDSRRRHRPTVWAVWGVGQAVIVGDALASLAQQVLLDSQVPNRCAAASRLARATSSMIVGQANDMAGEGLAEISVAACEEMERGKTGALLGAAASIGAELAGATAEQLSALEEFGVELGLAFQATDDVLGIWGDPSRTGKPAWSDLRQCKASLPVAAAMAAGGHHAEELRHLLGQRPCPEDGLARAALVVEQAGGRAYCEEAARLHKQSALQALESAPLAAPSRRQLADMAEFVVQRAF